MNRGRFKLVRKRGRSEVWNLFGQVVDTLTNARLPYVACYACKVLYTDTGGGTGNMTRHRCSMGSSYRNSVRRSSSDTTVGNDSLSFHQSSSSFESVGPFRHQSGEGITSTNIIQPPPTSPQQELLTQQQTQEQNLRILAQQHQRKVAAAATAAAAALILEQQQRVLIPQTRNQGTFSSSHSGGSGSSGFQSIGSYGSSSSSTSIEQQQQQLTGLNLSSLPSVSAPTMLSRFFGSCGGGNNSSSSSTTSASLISPIAAAAACMFQQQQQLIHPMTVEIARQPEEKQPQFGLLSTISPEYDSAASAPSGGPTQGDINYCGSTSSLTGQEDHQSPH
ncbi:hypothetical protein ACQ4LE_004548, partial [Meloidogyne hapla]